MSKCFVDINPPGDLYHIACEAHIVNDQVNDQYIAFAEGKYIANKVDKMEIALKECHETEYWIELLFHVKTIDKEVYGSLQEKCGTIRRKLIASIKTVKSKYNIQ